MNAIIETQVNEVVDTAAVESNAIVELDFADLTQVGGGLVSPCFA